MEVGVSMGIKNQNGSLKLTVMECGCYMKELDITLNGGASWFYQVYVVHNFVLQALCFLFLWKGLSKLNFPSPATSKYETHIIAFQILFKVFSFSLLCQETAICLVSPWAPPLVSEVNQAVFFLFEFQFIRHLIWTIWVMSEMFLLSTFF